LISTGSTRLRFDPARQAAPGDRLPERLRRRRLLLRRRLCEPAKPSSTTSRRRASPRSAARARGVLQELCGEEVQTWSRAQRGVVTPHQARAFCCGAPYVTGATRYRRPLQRAGGRARPEAARGGAHRIQQLIPQGGGRADLDSPLNGVGPGEESGSGSSPATRTRALQDLKLRARWRPRSTWGCASAAIEYTERRVSTSAISGTTVMNSPCASSRPSGSARCSCRGLCLRASREERERLTRTSTRAVLLGEA